MLRWFMLFSILGLAQLSSAPEAFEGLRFHKVPKPLAEGAVTQDWPRFLGPLDEATTRESPLLEEWPEEGLPGEKIPTRVPAQAHGLHFPACLVPGHFVALIQSCL